MLQCWVLKQNILWYPSNKPVLSNNEVTCHMGIDVFNYTDYVLYFNTFVIVRNIPQIMLQKKKTTNQTPATTTTKKKTPNQSGNKAFDFLNIHFLWQTHSKTKI